MTACLRLEPYCIVLYLSIPISAFQKRSRRQLTLWHSLHAEALPVTASEGLAQGPYVAARTGFELATLRSKDIDSTNAPPRPTYRQGTVETLSNKFTNSVSKAGGLFMQELIGDTTKMS